MKSTQTPAPARKIATRNISRFRISIRGVVQGVGFRPFVYQLAAGHNLKGWVRNTSGDVSIDVEGERGELDQFREELETMAPPMARIENVTVTAAHAAGYRQFEIQESMAEVGKYQLVSPDIATCADCLQEIFFPENRRYRYPFTNCTNCGPRFTIIEDIPYDRPKTTMRQFRMCPRCQQEYENPLDRRFHAQPNACPECGPHLQLLDAIGNSIATDDAITTTGRLLQEGKIIAIKGLGGFLLACDATSEKAVKLLRERKKRNGKPFAIMLPSIEEVKKHCPVTSPEEQLLTSLQSPIVLLKRKTASTIAPSVAPSLKYLGVMLPYTPLHHLLCRETGLPLVMTSGNLSEEPIAKDNEEALRRLKGITDYFLTHNRDIYSRYDDSVTMVESGKPQSVRRARGYAPYPIHLTFPAKQILACGAELKNTFCLTRDNYAFVSQHIGDMENLETLEHFESTIALYQKLFRIHPEAIAADMHLEYLPTKYARDLAERTGLPLITVQHHHAHTVSCMVDNGLNEPIIGVSLDGTGYGTDGNIWGGEFLVADYQHFQRLGYFQYVPMPGGAAAIRRPYRMAIGYLLTLFGEDALSEDLPFLEGIDVNEPALLKKQLERKINSPLTSSCGRLFDAVAALLGFKGEISYEAQAAIELEMAADESEHGSYPFTIAEQGDNHIVQFPEVFRSIINDLHHSITPAAIAMRFHHTVAQIVVEMCRHLSRKTGIRKVALSGGVFQNRLLLRLTVPALEKASFSVLTHRNVPANDGGISLGQAVIANFTVEKS
ncbi:carbamoyltransferase HypF [Chloroflexota bacterium]